MQINDATIWLEGLYREHYKPLCAVIRSQLYGCSCSDMAEDIAQDVFAHAHTEYNTLKDHPNICGWLYQNAYYRCHNQRRKEANIRLHTAFSLDADDWPDISDPSAQEAFENCLQVSHEEALAYLRDHLSEHDFNLLTEATYRDSGTKELSRKYDLSEGAVKMRLHRVRKRARKILSVFLKLFVTIILFKTY